MALLMDYMFHNNTFNNAYIRVEHISGTKENLRVTMSIANSQQEAHAGSYFDQFAFTMNGNVLKYDSSTSDRNFLTQAYNHVKNNIVESTDGRFFDLRSATDHN